MNFFFYLGARWCLGWRTCKQGEKERAYWLSLSRLILLLNSEFNHPPPCTGESLSQGNGGVSSDSVCDGGWLWGWAHSCSGFALCCGWQQSTLYFLTTLYRGWEQSWPAVPGFTEDRESPQTGGCCWNLMAFMCGAGLSSEVNYVTGNTSSVCVHS